MKMTENLLATLYSCRQAVEEAAGITHTTQKDNRDTFRITKK